MDRRYPRVDFCLLLGRTHLSLKFVFFLLNGSSGGILSPPESSVSIFHSRNASSKHILFDFETNRDLLQLHTLRPP